MKSTKGCVGGHMSWVGVLFIVKKKGFFSKWDGRHRYE